MAGLLNASQNVLRGPPAWDWDVGSDLWGWSLGLCILTPSLVTLIHSRATGALVMKRGEAWSGAALSGGRREGGPRSEEGADHELTPSCVSPDFLHNLA